MMRMFLIRALAVVATPLLQSRTFLLADCPDLQPARGFDNSQRNMRERSDELEPEIQSRVTGETLFAVDSGAADSALHPLKPRLLPENVSFVERGLWGESGFLRNIGIASPLTPEVRKSEIALRRTMLTLHQIGGFVTLGLMASAAYSGRQILDGRDNFRGVHQAFVVATIASYSLTALLAVLSPPPLIRRNEVSTTTIHKTLAWVHFAGMVVTPILGSLLNRRSSSYYDRARVHQVSAYITTGTLALSMIVLIF
jgi:hypothetical protein